MSELLGEGVGGMLATNVSNGEELLTNGAIAEVEEGVAEYLEEHDPTAATKEQLSTNHEGSIEALETAVDVAENENEDAATKTKTPSQLPKKRKELDVEANTEFDLKEERLDDEDDDEQPTSTARQAAKMENQVDENQCRVCTSKDALVSLFKMVNKQTIADKLMIICPTVTIALKDFMPQYICNPCLDNVNAALQLKTQCETTERELRKKLSRSKNKVRRPTGYVVIDAVLESEPENSDNDPNDDVEFKVSEEEDVVSADSDDSEFSTSKKKRATRSTASKRAKRKTNAGYTPGPKSKKKKQRMGRSAKRHSSPSPILVKEESSEDEQEMVELIEPIIIKNKGKKKKTKTKPPSDDEQTEFQCDECDQVFARRLSLTLHKKAHTPRETLKCEVCGQVFKMQGAYRKHIQKHNEEPSGFECTKCEFTGASKADLRRHLVDEHDEQGLLHECEKCKRKFVSAARLERHKDGRCPGQERPIKARPDVESFTVGKDLFKSVAPLTTTYWSDEFSD